MKRFRWGDVVPGCGEDCADIEDHFPDLFGLHAVAVHGVLRVDPEDVDAVHLHLTSVD